MRRSILAILAGIVVGGIVVGLIEIPGNRMHPLPPDTDMKDWDAIKRHAAKAPTAALLGVAIAWTVGPAMGAFVAAVIACEGQLFHGEIIGVVFLAMDLAMISSLPHPMWLIVVGMIGPLFGGWIGAILGRRFAPGATSSPRPSDMRAKNVAC